MLRILVSSLLALSSLFTPLSLKEEGIHELPNVHQVPRMVTMSFTHDTKHEMAFNYNTDYHTDTILEVSQDEDFSKDVIEFTGTTSKSKVSNDGFIHQVKATNLKENTTYYYRLGDKELNIYSPIGQFKTENNHPFTSFVHLSDPQMMEESNALTYGRLLNELTSSFDLDFLSVTGDLVNNSWLNNTPHLEQWEYSLTAQFDYLKNIPLMAVAGNHDESDYDFSSRFNYPLEDDQDGKGGIYYSYDYHDMHFIALNTNDTSNREDKDHATGLSSKQLTWLENDLKENSDAKWKVIMMHKGIFDAGSHSSNISGEDYDIPLIREQLAPLFSQYHVDLVLQGHDHLYSRSYPLTCLLENEELKVSYQEETIKVNKDNKEYDTYLNPKGPIYINTGSASGSKYYSVVNYDHDLIPLEKSYGSTNQMCTYYYVENDTLYGEIYELIDGKLSLYDQFALKKDDSILEENKPNDVGDNLQNNNNTLITILIVVSCVVLFGGLITFIIIKRRKHNG